jgi:alginate O-acetyltransferase complex protein AlgI
MMSSYLFYASWNPPFVFLLLFSTVLEWIAGKQMLRSRERPRRRAWLPLSLVANLALLGFFKYGEFLLQNWQALLRIIGVEYAPAPLEILLPVGISFYTFQSLSYSIDVYRGRITKPPSFRDFALYVSFFQFCL